MVDRVQVVLVEQKKEGYDFGEIQDHTPPHAKARYKRAIVDDLEFAQRPVDSQALVSLKSVQVEVLDDGDAEGLAVILIFSPHHRPAATRGWETVPEWGGLYIRLVIYSDADKKEVLESLVTPAISVHCHDSGDAPQKILIRTHTKGWIKRAKQVCFFDVKNGIEVRPCS